MGCWAGAAGAACWATRRARAGAAPGPGQPPDCSLPTAARPQIISGHPPVLSYSVEARLAPFWDYLGGLGVQVRAVWGGGAQLALQPVSLPLLPGRR